MYKGKISARIPEAKEGQQIVSEVVKVAENFKDAVEIFGSEKVCVDTLNQMYKITIQNKLRHQGREKLGLLKTATGGSKNKGIARVE